MQVMLSQQLSQAMMAMQVKQQNDLMLGLVSKFIHKQ